MKLGDVSLRDWFLGGILVEDFLGAEFGGRVVFLLFFFGGFL